MSKREKSDLALISDSAVVAKRDSFVLLLLLSLLLICQSESKDLLHQVGRQAVCSSFAFAATDLSALHGPWRWQGQAGLLHCRLLMSARVRPAKKAEGAGESPFTKCHSALERQEGFFPNSVPLLSP